VVAPAGTAVKIVVADVIVNGAEMAPNLTATKLARYEVPGTVIVTAVPTLPVAGVKEVTVGFAARPADFENVTVVVVDPPLFVTLMKWVAVARVDGTSAIINVGLITLNVAEVPVAAPLEVLPNLTAEAVLKLVPVILTVVKPPPLFGVSVVLIVGAGFVTVKLFAETTVPPGVVIEIF